MQFIRSTSFISLILDIVRGNIDPGFIFCPFDRVAFAAKMVKTQTWPTVDEATRHKNIVNINEMTLTVGFKFKSHRKGPVTNDQWPWVEIELEKRQTVNGYCVFDDAKRWMTIGQWSLIGQTHSQSKEMLEIFMEHLRLWPLVNFRSCGHMHPCTLSIGLKTLIERPVTIQRGVRGDLRDAYQGMFNFPDRLLHRHPNPPRLV